MTNDASSTSRIEHKSNKSASFVRGGVTTLTTAPAQPSSTPSSLPARHPLVSYFLIAFGFSWLMFLPPLLTYYGLLSLSNRAVRSFAIAGLLGPIRSEERRVGKGCRSRGSRDA